MKFCVLKIGGHLCIGKPYTYSYETPRRGIHKDDKITFKMSSYKYFKFSHRLPGKVEIKTFINGLCSSTFSLRNTNRSPELLTTKAYPAGRVPINK